MRCLIVDDDLKHVVRLKEALRDEAFAVDTALDGQRGSFLARVNQYDVIILDHLVPKKTGEQICLELRNAGKHTPVIGLVRKPEVSHRLDMFAAGVDDCLCKPYALSELIARIRAILRRGVVLKEDVFQVGELMLNVTTQLVYVGGKLVELTLLQYRILELLMRNRGRIITKEMFMERLWNMDADPFSNAIGTHIWKIRKRLGRKTQKLIRNIPGRGYIID
jgi:DNA-binding response OmpR family regulator